MLQVQIGVIFFHQLVPGINIYRLLFSRLKAFPVKFFDVHIALLTDDYLSLGTVCVTGSVSHINGM
jgi:hypothetical protein